MIGYLRILKTIYSIKNRHIYWYIINTYGHENNEIVFTW